jgi:hypothetical protein
VLTSTIRLVESAYSKVGEVTGVPSRLDTSIASWAASSHRTS